MTPARYALRAGEYLAIDPSVIQQDANGMFFLFGPDPPENERRGTVAVVHIRGALSHFKTGCGDSYEYILERVVCALEDQPSTVVFCIESPGGVVAGLNECVFKLQRMSAESGVKFIAYVDEMAASAAFAICCACEEILAPPAAVIGSVGCISTMVSQVKRDQLDGLEYRLITSGRRKADGHLHAPITDEAVKAETERNEELAAQFFALAAVARSMSVDEIASLEAAIYLASKARKVGLIDDVMSYDDVIGALDQTIASEVPEAAPGAGILTDRRAKRRVKGPRLDNRAKRGPSSVAQRGTPGVDPMSVKLDALIAKTEASFAGEADPKKKARLASLLAQYQATQRAMEHEEPDGDEGSEDDEDEDESKSKMAAKKAEEAKRKAEAAKHRAKAMEHKQKAAEYEERAKQAESGGEEDEDEEKAKALLADDARAAAVAEQSRLAMGAEQRISKIEADLAKREQAASIKEALADERITPAEAKMLGGKSPTWAAEYIATREGVRVVNVDDGHLIVPDASEQTSASKAELAEINERIASAGITNPAHVEKLRAEMIANRRKSANGASPVGRY